MIRVFHLIIDPNHDEREYDAICAAHTAAMGVSRGEDVAAIEQLYASIRAAPTGGLRLVEVAQVDGDGLSAAYEKTNHIDHSWDTRPAPGVKVLRSRNRSTSVGDVLVRDGRAHLVAPIGFREFAWDADQQQSAPTKPVLKTFDIEVTRVGVGFATITVEAAGQAEAEELALDEAGNHSFSEKSSEYELTNGSSAPVEASAVSKPPATPEKIVDSLTLEVLKSLTDEQILEALRDRGVAVLAWTPRDLVNGATVDTHEEALELLAKAAPNLEQRLSDLGWTIIGDSRKPSQRDQVRGG